MLRLPLVGSLVLLCACSPPLPPARSAAVPSASASAAPAPTGVRPRSEGEPRVVAVRPRSRFADEPRRRVTLEGFDLPRVEAEFAPGKEATLLVASLSPLDTSHAVVKRLGDKQALLDRQSLAFVPLNEHSSFVAAGPRFLLGLGENLSVIERATGKELKSIEVQNSPEVFPLLPDERVVENDPAIDPGGALFVGGLLDRVRVLSLPDLAVRLERPARVALRLPGDEGKFLLESWKKGPGGANRLVHELHVLDARAAKVTATFAAPRGSGDPVPSTGMTPPPRHAFAASADGKHVAMAFGKGLWVLEIASKRWKTLRALPRPKNPDFPLDDMEFEVGFTASGDVCTSLGGEDSVIPAPLVPSGSTLRVGWRGDLCVPFTVAPDQGFKPIPASSSRRYEQASIDVRRDGRFAASLDSKAGANDQAPIDYRVTLVDLSSGRQVKVFPGGKRVRPSIDDRLFLRFTDDDKLLLAAMGGEATDFGGLFNLDGTRVSPATLDDEASPSFPQALERAGVGPEATKIKLQSKSGALLLADSSGELHPVNLPRNVDPEGRWLERERVALLWDRSSLLVLRVPLATGAPCEHIATLVPRPKGVVTLLQGGGFHSSDVADTDLGCLSGETLAPIASCRARFFVEDGLRLVLSGHLPAPG